jgi:hypothetical protein
MASTYSTNLKIELIGTGEQSGAWGAATNTNLGTALEQAIVGRGSPVFSADADLTISLSNSSAAQTARAFVLNVTSVVSLTATRNLIVPTIEKPYVVSNATTGGQSITVKTSAGTGVAVPNGARVFLYADGTNVVQMQTKDSVGLGNVDNTSDANKPVSTATQTALNAKQDTLVSGTNIKTVNSASLLGSGNVAVGDVVGPASATDNTLPRFDGTTGKLLQGSGVVVNDSNNVGVGVTPSASTIPTFEVPSNYLINQLGYANNAYYNGGWTYKTTGAATLLQTVGGFYKWYVAPSGTAGAAVTWVDSMTLDNSGNLTATGNITAYSDERLKRNWAGMPTDFIERLAGVKHGTYERIDGGMRQVGVSAQSLRELMPEAVLEDDKGTLSVAYGNAALAAVVQLAQRVVELEARLAALEAR